MPISILTAPDDLNRAILGFARTLHAAGVKTDHHRVRTAYRCLDALGGASDRDHLYWAGRFAFCSCREDLPRYDRAFEAWFGGVLAARQTMPSATSEIKVAVPGDVGGASEAGDEEGKKTATASDSEVLRGADIALLTPNARREVERWISLLRPVGATRRTSRFQLRGAELVHRRKTVRAALRAGGEVAEIALRDRREVPRRVVFLIDVSGSMKAYASAYLRFAYATRRARAKTEVFTVGTRLTRVTRSISHLHVERAIKDAMGEIPDWSGGTRLGSQLRQFVRDYGARGMARGAIVVIASDGWERGDVSALGESMAHLSRLAHRVIWVNPHLHRPGFAPLTAGMEISMPHISTLLSGHSLAAFEGLTQEIAQSR